MKKLAAQDLVNRLTKIKQSLIVDMLKLENQAKGKYYGKINGEEYYSENDVLDAYGAGVISRRQMERALKASSKSVDKRETLFEEQKMIQECIVAITMNYLEDEYEH